MAILTVVSIGTTFVIATAGIDLSIPSGIILGEVFARTGPELIQVGWRFRARLRCVEDTTAFIILAALAASLFAGLLSGSVNGFLIAYMRIPPMLATLGTPRCRPRRWAADPEWRERRDLRPRPVATGHLFPGISNLVLIAACRHHPGLHRHAHVHLRPPHARDRSSEEAARRVGLNVPRHLLKVYIVGGMASGFAGFLSLAYFSTTSVGGHATDNLQAITAVALGGTSLFGGVALIIGTVIGVWIPAVLQNGFIIVGVNPYWQLIAVGIVLVFAVWVDQLRRRGQNRR